MCIGILTLRVQKWIPDSEGFGRIPGPQIWKSLTQVENKHSTDVESTN